MDAAWLERFSGIAAGGLCAGLGATLAAGYVQWKLARRAERRELLAEVCDSAARRLDDVRDNLVAYWTGSAGRDMRAPRILADLSQIDNEIEFLGTFGTDHDSARKLWYLLHETGTSGDFGAAPDLDPARAANIIDMAGRLSNELRAIRVKHATRSPRFVDHLLRGSE